MKKHNHSLKEVSLLIIAFNISSLLLLRTQTSCFVKIKKSLGRGNKNYFLIILNRRKGQLLGELRLQRRFRIAPFLKSQQQLKQCLFWEFLSKNYLKTISIFGTHMQKKSEINKCTFALKVMKTIVPLLLLIYWYLVPKIEVCLKYFLDKKSPKTSIVQN